MRILFSLLLTFVIVFAKAQATYVLPGTLSDEIADRWDILYNFDHEVFASQRNTSREELVSRAFQLYTRDHKSKLDQSDIYYILSDNNEYHNNHSDKTLVSGESNKVYDSTGVFFHISHESDDGIQTSEFDDTRKPVLKHFYKSRANFFEVNSDNFFLRANPIINLRYGNAIDDPNIIFQNTRGAEIRAEIDDNIYVYTSLLENQRRFNNFLETRISRDRTVPGQGFFKTYDSAVIDNLGGYDYLNAQAYVGINATKSVAIELGHGKHFIGNGIRSLLLSDYAHNYFYLKFNTRIWKFHYQNIFAELAPISGAVNPGNFLLPKKYMANHYLSYKPSKNFEVGLFEAIVFAREDHFEFQYLNPVILYRTVEQFLDSPDNALIGLNAKWNIKNKYQLYGQMILDEFKLSELTSGEGWWANKYGFQIGAKAVNLFGIDHLDAQVEYNKVRPYTYAHRDSLERFPQQSTASYSHHNQPLAHPLGSNFNELVMNLRYRPTSKLFLNSRILSATYGQDPTGQNFGSNILLITGSREGDYGNEIGQGINTKLFAIGLDVSYQFYHNYFIDLNMLYRSTDADIDELDLDTKYIGGGLRINLGQIRFDY